MKKSERILFALVCLALVLEVMLIPGSGILLVLSFNALACVYMFGGLFLFNGIPLRRVFREGAFSEVSKGKVVGAMGAGVALSLTTIGLLFRFQSWPGADFLLATGLLLLLVVLIIGAVKYLQSKTSYYMGIFLRASVIGGLGLIMMLAPSTAWVEIIYRNHPAYLDAFKKAVADPDNQELWEKVREERQKIDR